VGVADVERAVVELCLSPQPPADKLATLGDERIWRIYRDMVRHRLRGECRVAMPRLHAALGDEALDRLFEAHLAEEPPRTRLFREVVLDFARSAEPRLRADQGLPPWAAELCRYEATLWEVGDLPDRVGLDLLDFAFDGVAVTAGALRLLRLTHAVQGKPDEHGAYPERPTLLAVHRPADERRGRAWTLSPFAFDLLERLQQEEDTVSDAIKAVAQARGVGIDQKFLEGLTDVLARWVQRGVLLGSKP
jgi:hypothetical protein